MIRSLFLEWNHYVLYDKITSEIYSSICLQFFHDIKVFSQVHIIVIFLIEKRFKIKIQETSLSEHLIASKLDPLLLFPTSGVMPDSLNIRY